MGSTAGRGGRDLCNLDTVRRRHYRKSIQAELQYAYTLLYPRMRIADITAEPLVTNEKPTLDEVRPMTSRSHRGLITRQLPS
jgi:ABC-type microcin C transport system duplicated ATPase subunit YejF